MIERIFHPIGQGAFYSERHKDFNIVYDCGTEWKNRANKTINKTIKQSFSTDDEIDILFISHFDYDHVSKIKILKEHVKRIKKVVMPLLHDNEKHLLANIYRALNFNILTLINNPQDFFGDDTQIITITQTDNTDNNETPINNSTEPQNIDTLQTTSIQSGSILRKSFDTYDWIFIPYNYQYNTRNNQLEKLLLKNGFDIDRLKTDTNYTLDEIVKDIGISKAKGGKIFREVYDILDGRINQNSMLLYSGLNSVRKSCEQEVFLFDYPHRYYKRFHHIRWYRMMREEHRVSCIYTGDTDLNIVKIKSIFRNFWESVGTIQIPHHGDLKSFDKSILDDKYYWCPISVGEKNSYGHPSPKVIANIISQDSCPILVTENLSSCFIEHIRC